MAFIFPSRWLQQPQGHVEIDWSHPLSQGLVFFAIPSQRTSPELVGGGALNLIGSSTFQAGADGVGISSPSTSTGGYSYAYRQDLFRTMATDFTVATSVDIRTLTANSKLICAPMQSNVWSQPYQVISLSRSSTGGQLGLYIGTSTGGTSLNALFPAGTAVTGNGFRYLATRSGAAANLFVNGEQYTPSSSTLTTAPIVFYTGGHVALLNRSAGMNGEGTDGVSYYGAFWNRALSDAEASAFNAAPYQMLLPVRRKLYFDTSALPPQNISGGMAAKKPVVSGTVTQTFPARALSGGMVAPKPVISGTVTQTFPARALSGGMSVPKPVISGAITQTFPARALSGGMVAPKPVMSGGITQTFPARALSGGMTAKKPIVSGLVTQSAIGGISVSGGMAAKKPVISGAITQTFPARALSGGMVAKKPTLSGAFAQVFPAQSLSGGMVTPKPVLSGSIEQAAIAPHVISGGMVAPKPVMKATIGGVRRYTIPAGIELGAGGQLALASGYVLLLATDPEGDYIVPHPLAIAQRTVEAGYGASALQFEGPLDPAELKYFTVRWDVELAAATDSIVPDDGSVEGQSVFLTLAGPAIASGIQIHAQSQDERSVTFWLKVDPSMQSRPQWNAQGELHIITVRIITVRGQVFERDISFRVKQL